MIGDPGKETKKLLVNCFGAPLGYQILFVQQCSMWLLRFSIDQHQSGNKNISA